MGSCATKNHDNEVSIPQNPRLLRFYHQYMQIININHPLNVNQKYNSFFTLIQEQFVGQGIKRTNCYESRLSLEEWQAKRQEFWGRVVLQLDSRIEGAKENWLTLKAAIDADENTAKIMLQAADLRLVNNSIQIVYDQTGQKYDLPVFVLHKPVSFPQKMSYEQNIQNNFDKKDIKFKVRCAKWVKDHEFTLKNTDKIQVLKDEILKEEDSKKMRIFFNGKELHSHHMFGNYGVYNDAVVQVFL